MTDEEFDRLSKGFVDIKAAGVTVRSPEGTLTPVEIISDDSSIILRQDGEDTIEMSLKQARLVAWLLDNDADPSK